MPEQSSYAISVEPATCLFCEESFTDTVARGRDYEYESTPDTFEWVRCRHCELMFIQPRPAADAMEIIYPSNYYAYHEGENENAFIKRFRDRMEGAKVRRYQALLGSDSAEIVDVGCGDGRLLNILRRLGSKRWNLAGIELDDSAAASAKDAGFEVQQGDFEGLDVSSWSGRFDLALMHHMLEHTRDPRAVVRKVRGLLRPGGFVSIETPELRGWDFDLFKKRYWGGYHTPRHFYLFDRDTLTRLLEEEGFEVFSVRSMLSPAFWIVSFHNLLADQRGLRWFSRFWHPQNLLAVSLSTAIELLQSLTGNGSSNLQLMARKRGGSE